MGLTSGARRAAEMWQLFMWGSRLLLLLLQAYIWMRQRLRGTRGRREDGPSKRLPSHVVYVVPDAGPHSSTASLLCHSKALGMDSVDVYSPDCTFSPSGCTISSTNPPLVIVIHPVFSLFGLCYKFLRGAEIHHIPTYINRVQEKQLAAVLRRYQSSVQRCGR